jgi:hypothetical protein
MFHRRALLATVGLAAFGCPMRTAAAAALPRPSGAVLLTVTGSIAATNADGAALLDGAQLMGWGPGRLRTATPWTDGESDFEGVFGSQLLAALGAGGTMLRCSALNDYHVDIPAQEMRAYPILLALRRDGAPLSPRDLGPIWVVYPWTQHPELDDRVHRQRSIWQLNAIEVR